MSVNSVNVVMEHLRRFTDEKPSEAAAFVDFARRRGLSAEQSQPLLDVQTDHRRGFRATAMQRLLRWAHHNEPGRMLLLEYANELANRALPMGTGATIVDQRASRELNRARVTLGALRYAGENVRVLNAELATEQGGRVDVVVKILHKRNLVRRCEVWGVPARGSLCCPPPAASSAVPPPLCFRIARCAQ
jgi:hypothetical protein